MPEKLEIDALRAALEISASGGVTGATKSLGLSQSAVSPKMRRLETTLNCNLPSRKKGGTLFSQEAEALNGFALRISVDSSKTIPTFFEEVSRNSPSTVRNRQTSGTRPTKQSLAQSLIQSDPRL